MISAARLLLVLVVSVAACSKRPPAMTPAPEASLALQAEFLIPAGSTFTEFPDVRFGGISGVVALPGSSDLLAVSDDRDNSRIFRLRLEQEPFRVVPLGVLPLQLTGGAPRMMDPEGIALTGEGNILVSSEGILEQEPRIPPSISEFTPDGRFVRQLPVPSRFIPNERGPLTTGVRTNAGFESLTVTPDGQYLFTANELPLAQDGSDSVGGIRILRYALTSRGYEPDKEFAYRIAPLGELPFTPLFAVNGVVELLASSATELLALERGFAQAPQGQTSLNRIRIFRVALDKATDVSRIERLGTNGGYAPASKLLVSDLNLLPGLSPALSGLDNFEALAWVAGGAGRPQLLAASDDNFSSRQVTAWLLFR